MSKRVQTILSDENYQYITEAGLSMSSAINNAVTLWRTGQMVSTSKPYETESVSTTDTVHKILVELDASYFDFHKNGDDFTHEQWNAIDYKLNTMGCLLLGREGFRTIVIANGNEIFPRM